ncbi:patatin-like phospholipase domain-containing protein 2 [Corythoichthys intestinalis]|uniref:patatin-like phospholipase domain-containing protein 2 n=1 Tax=Corythoichthys intestinalis TaxID=161448 RepID=UPI0025A4FD4E|nr:patatin-like phospholipase domain-containing protein 2 [Corythoichthys intestinalis]
MVLEVSSVNFREAPSSISFSGSGFLSTYQIGVAQCFLQNAPWILHKAPRILGASAGSLVAAAVACEINLISMRNEMLNFAKVMKAFALGPFNPSVDILQWLKYVLYKNLPTDAHLLANGRLAVAMTRLDDGHYTVITEYQSKEDVVQALLCSCFVPGYCGMLPPSLNGVHYMDGGFSKIQPVLALPSHTLTVSPFSGETDICPPDQPCMLDMVVTGLTLKGNLANGLRFWNALYPIKLETVEQAYHSGYKDAYEFLLRNELLSNMNMFTMSQGFDNYSCTKTPIFPETAPEEEEDNEIETTELPFFQGSQSKQINTSVELQSSTGKLTITELPLTFDSAKNVLLGNVTTYWSMLGPSGYFTYLLVPMMLLFQTLIETVEIVEVLLRKTPERAFWTWCGLRQFAVFFFGIMICTFKKNLNDRMLSIMQLLSQAQNEVPQKHSRPPRRKFASPLYSESVRFGGLRSIPPLRGL